MNSIVAASQILSSLGHGTWFEKVLRRFALILFLFATTTIVSAAPTNYFCIVCGKGPLTGHVWLHPRGAICDHCEKIQERCTICGLPVKDGDGHIKTADGRFICKFDKPNVILTLDQAKELFDQVRDQVVDLYGREFALKYTDVTVNLFDVDYWSEKGQANSLHKFGFASTRKTADGRCTHEVIMWSGRTREEMLPVAAHEYTHLWINENRPEVHVIDGDTIEAICELTAYKLMKHKNLPDMQKRILENPYTNGKIKTLIAAEREGGTDYILSWVKNGTAETFDADANLPAVSALVTRPIPMVAAPVELPTTLKFSGLLTIGKSRQAIINGMAFAAGDQKQIKLRGKTVTVRCLEIQDTAVILELNGSPDQMILKKGEEKLPP